MGERPARIRRGLKEAIDHVLSVEGSTPAGDARRNAHPRPLLDDACLPALGDTPVHYMLAVLSDDGRAPVARYAIYGTEDSAENVARALGSAHRVCLLRNHGTIAVGSTAGEALPRTELPEQLAEIYYRARTAGQPVILTAEEMAQVTAKIHDYTNTSRRYPEIANDDGVIEVSARTFYLAIARLR